MMKMAKRSKIFYIALMMAFAALTLRTFWLATGTNAKRTEAVMNNRETSVILYRTKGMIYDENLIPLAGGQACYYFLVNPRDFQSENAALLAEYTGADIMELKEKLKKETPFVLQSEREIPPMDGVYQYIGERRYSGISKHLLGYLDGSGEVGLSGVEKEYNDYLNLFSSKSTVSYNTDAIQGVLAGLGVRAAQQSRSNSGVVLTLNADLCQALEQSMDRHITVGAAVVLDCKTGEIKASTSRPDYDEKNIAAYLNSTEGELINRVFSSQTVGSVFKIILAACALEAGLDSFVYTCNGGIVIGDLAFACHNHSGHGEVDLQEAFSESCNTYFIALGQLLGYDRIHEMAIRFGYGESIEILGSMCSSAGTFPKKSSNMALANLSIGQGDLLTSPLQVARMTAVLANGGRMPTISLYKGLYLNGLLKSNPNRSETQIISSEIAEKLREFCVDTVENGTGTAACPTYGTAGGKTSSAQTGIMENGEEKLNVYFTGFYPAEDPQYVITVFAEGGVSGGKTCGPVFREICDFMAENGLTEAKTVVY